MTLWFVHHNPASAFRKHRTRVDLDRSPCPTIMAGEVFGDCPSHYWLEDDGVPYEVIDRVVHDTSGTFSQGDVTDRPCPAITIGVNGLNSAHYQVEYYVTETPPPMVDKAAVPHKHARIATADRPALTIKTHDRSRDQVWYDIGPAAVPRADGKPPYRVPSMAEIAARPRNGYQVVSTFSGCGGSCLGFEMEGYTVRWASEFIPAAQETYRANHPGVVLNTDDIRAVTPEQVCREAGLRPGEIDVLEGSPPCAAFSTAGKREEGWGKVKAYSDTRQRVDDLFFEFARLLKGLRPKVFVAENVSGLVKGTAKGYFVEIMRALKGCGYAVEARLLDAQWLGVPQMRQRIIFVGVRNDLVGRFGVRPAFPSPLPYRYSVREALPWVTQVQRAVGFKWNHDGAEHPADGHGMLPADRPMPSVLQDTPVDVTAARLYVEEANGLRSPADGSGHIYTDRTDLPMPTVQAGRPVAYRVEPEADITRYAIGREWDKLGPGGQSDRYFQLVRQDPERACGTITAEGGNTGAAGITHPTERRKFSIAELRRICGFPDDFALTGSYAQQWERLGRAVPPVMMAHVARVVRDEILARIPAGA